VAVEMEGKGFLDAVDAFPGIQGIVIRGISDLLEKKLETDQCGWQEIASNRASAFAFEILSKLTDVDELKTVKANHFTGRLETDQRVMRNNDDSISRFPPQLQRENITGLWLSRFEYKSFRGHRLISGCQYDVEYLQLYGRRYIQGGNLLCSTTSGAKYWHNIEAQILSNYIMGNWFNHSTKNLGLFQLYINNTYTLMTGSHIGNANDNSVQCGTWTWLRINLEEGNCATVAESIREKAMMSPSEIDDIFKLYCKAETSITLKQVLKES
jgi:hypothetical protein